MAKRRNRNKDRSGRGTSTSARGRRGMGGRLTLNNRRVGGGYVAGRGTNRIISGSDARTTTAKKRKPKGSTRPVRKTGKGSAPKATKKLYRAKEGKTRAR